MHARRKFEVRSFTCSCSEILQSLGSPLIRPRSLFSKVIRISTHINSSIGYAYLSDNMHGLRGYSLKLSLIRCRLHLRKKFFSQRVTSAVHGTVFLNVLMQPQLTHSGIVDYSNRRSLDRRPPDIRHALRRPCTRCGGPKGMEPAAGAFTNTRDSRPLQDGIKDLSSLHPVTSQIVSHAVPL